MNKIEFKPLNFLKNLGLNIIYKFGSSSSQTWKFYIYHQAKLEHSLLNNSEKLQEKYLDEP